ncbi:MAG: TrkH family potassium uptake protein [archaeon]
MSGHSRSGTLHYLGLTLIVLSFTFFVGTICSIALGELDLAPSFLMPGLVGILVGYIIQRMTTPGDLQLNQAMTLSAISWAVFPALAMIPMKLITGTTWLKAYFESMSGLTATGLTIFDNVEALPKSILLWRSLIEWVGGVGIIVFFLAIMAVKGPAASRLYVSEGRIERIKPNVTGTVLRIWWIYILYTVVGTILFWLFGMPLFDAVNHSMTAIATGGFSTKNSSLAYYNSIYIEGAAILVMLLGATSFGVHYDMLAKHRNPLRNPEVKAMLAIIAVFVPVIAVSSLSIYRIPEAEAWRFSLFESVSALSGTGFSSSPLPSVNQLAKWLLTILMIIGGGYGSTSSAIKIFRLVVVFKYLWWVIRRELSPSFIFPLKFGRREIQNEEIFEAFRLIFLYLVALAVGTGALVWLGFDIGNSLFECASAQGNVGLSVGIVSPSLSPLGQLVLIIEMWIGRLEILPALVFVQSLAKSAKGIFFK